MQRYRLRNRRLIQVPRQSFIRFSRPGVISQRARGAPSLDVQHVRNIVPSETGFKVVNRKRAEEAGDWRDRVAAV